MLNAPNLICLTRLVLAFVVFAMIQLTDWWIATTVIFVIAVATDALDGYLARKYNQVTVFGRILDPMVDKIIICGSFIFLQQIAGSGINAWITLTIVVRELYITSLRGFFEQEGIDFSAKMSGKLKMVLQSAAIPASMLSLLPSLADSATFLLIRDGLIWATVAITIYSGIEYTFRGVKLYRQKQAGDAA